MSDGESILRVAAKGDGVTASGRHVALSAPGDLVRPDGALEWGPHHAVPPCRHFPECGGCQLQHLDDETLAGFVRDRVVNTAAGQGLAAETVAPPYLSPPRTRRRATLHAMRAGGRVAVGFHAQGSHRIVDMRECHVLRPELFALVAPLRALLAQWPGKRLAADVHLALADRAVSVEIKGLALEGLTRTEAMLDFARAHGLARLTLDQGYGAETLWEPDPLATTLSGVRVALPPGAFLQATADGETALVSAVHEWLGDAATVADLFAGLGTFALSLEGQITAAEAGRDAVLALKSAAGRASKQLVAEHRDLYRRPYDVKELSAFDAVVLDPPRAGALEQVQQLATPAVPRLAYVSCNPATFARDAEILASGGYKLDWVRPVGQFRWSTHVELAAAFSR